MDHQRSGTIGYNVQFWLAAEFGKPGIDRVVGFNPGQLVSRECLLVYFPDTVLETLTSALRDAEYRPALIYECPQFFYMLVCERGTLTSGDEEYRCVVPFGGLGINVDNLPTEDKCSVVSGYPIC